MGVRPRVTEGVRLTDAVGVCDKLDVRLEVCEGLCVGVPDWDGEDDEVVDCDEVAVGVKPPVTDWDGVPEGVPD